MRHFVAKEKIIIHADKPLPVHVDGDVIGETPVDIHISPRAVRIVVPGA
jgi:diacylglycerol kinase family enzyme